jgi:hypothetical protein
MPVVMLARHLPFFSFVYLSFLFQPAGGGALRWRAVAKE